MGGTSIYLVYGDSPSKWVGCFCNNSIDMGPVFSIKKKNPYTNGSVWKSWCFCGKIPRNGYLFSEKLPLDMGMTMSFESRLAHHGPNQIRVPLPRAPSVIIFVWNRFGRISFFFPPNYEHTQIKIMAHLYWRPHVTREKAVSCQITFKLYCFFSQFVANFSKASLSCYIFCDLRQLMVILRIDCVIYCDFAIVCDIYCDLWQFCNNFKFLSLFCFLPLFP